MQKMPIFRQFEVILARQEIKRIEKLQPIKLHFLTRKVCFCAIHIGQFTIILFSQTMSKSTQNPLQHLIDQEFNTQTELKSIEAAIENLQNSYLQKFSMGNLILGWETYMLPLIKEKPHVYAKDKYFSQSSLVSPSSTQLLKIQDQNIQPFGEHRFATIKKCNMKKNKKIKKNRK